jgi:hypothetical protein
MKIDVTPIGRDHINTLTDERTGGRNRADVLTLFGLPFLLACSLAVLRFRFHLDAVNAILYAFAILTGLLFNLLVLIFTASTQASPSILDEKARREFLRRIFASVCYAIVVSIILVIVAVTSVSYMRFHSESSSGDVFTFLLSCLSANCTLTLLMLVKSMYVFMRKELSRPERKADPKAA